MTHFLGGGRIDDDHKLARQGNRAARAATLVTRLQAMQRQINAKHFAVLRLNGKGTARKLTCVLDNWGISAEANAHDLITTYGEELVTHLDQSLLPVLEGNAPLDRHHDAVRSEYLESLDKPANSRGTMYFDGRYKLSLYHTHHLGELYDLATDPGEHEDLWDSPAHQALKAELMQRSFDATVQALDIGSPRIGPM